MPSGHTDKDTINRRRPLTPNMRFYLGLCAETNRFVPDLGVQDISCKNAMRALLNRGYVEYHMATVGFPESWSVTKMGSAAFCARATTTTDEEG